MIITRCVLSKDSLIPVGSEEEELISSKKNVSITLLLTDANDPLYKALVEELEKPLLILRPRLTYWNLQELREAKDVVLIPVTNLLLFEHDSIIVARAILRHFGMNGSVATGGIRFSVDVVGKVPADRKRLFSYMDFLRIRRHVYSRRNVAQPKEIARALWNLRSVESRAYH